MPLLRSVALQLLSSSRLRPIVRLQSVSISLRKRDEVQLSQQRDGGRPTTQTAAQMNQGRNGSRKNPYQETPARAMIPTRDQTRSQNLLDGNALSKVELLRPCATQRQRCRVF